MFRAIDWEIEHWEISPASTVSLPSNPSAVIPAAPDPAACDQTPTGEGDPVLRAEPQSLQEPTRGTTNL